jgi:hypothetical protein
MAYIEGTGSKDYVTVGDTGKYISETCMSE